MLFAKALSTLGFATAAVVQSDWKENIKNVVVLVLENRSFDNLMGSFSYDSSINGLLKKEYCNPVSTTNATLICATQVEPDAVVDDPSHSVSGTSFGLYQSFQPDEEAIRKGEMNADMQGFLEIQSRVHHLNNTQVAAHVLDYYLEEHVPVMAHLSREFLLFDQWFASVPGPTNPNRAYLTSGTSNGIGSNDGDWNFGTQHPQTSIFQQLSERNLTWINYSNSSGTTQGFFEPGTKSHYFNPDSLFYEWVWKSGTHATNVKGIQHFYDDAKQGNLPAFSYINPECCSYNSMHPPSPISMGEAFVKTIYDAVRGSPQWNETLLVITFDEGGGFADHVSPPVNVPAGTSKIWTEKDIEGNMVTFDFKRLGVRVPTLLISPFVGRGVVEHGLFTHTSLLATLSKMWNLGPFSDRVAWSKTFDHLFLTSPRDAPEDLDPPNYNY